MRWATEAWLISCLVTGRSYAMAFKSIESGGALGRRTQPDMRRPESTAATWHPSTGPPVPASHVPRPCAAPWPWAPPPCRAVVVRSSPPTMAATEHGYGGFLLAIGVLSHLCCRMKTLKPTIVGMVGFSRVQVTITPRRTCSGLRPCHRCW